MRPGDSVLMVVPRWVRDGGVLAHIEASTRALLGAGMRVSVLAARVDEDFLPAGVTVHVSPELYDRRAPLERRLGGALSSDPTVVHINQLGDPEVVARLRRIAPVVISAHGYVACTSGVHYFRPGEACTRPHGPGCVPNLLRCAHTRNPLRLPGQYRLASSERSALRACDLAVSYSSAVDAHLAQNGIAQRRIVPYFPTVEPARPSQRAGGRRVMFAGRVVPSKGIGVLIDAACGLDAQVVVCGDGWQSAAMRKLARRRGLEHRVEFRGWLAPRELAQEFADASVVAVPSLWPEPFGIVGIEGFAAGRPAVASDTGGVRDWLEHGVSGLAVPAGDAAALARALGELLDDPARRDRMGAAGKATVESRFSAERHLAAIGEAYDAARAHWESERSSSSARPSALAA